MPTQSELRIGQEKRLVVSLIDRIFIYWLTAKNTSHRPALTHWGRSACPILGARAISTSVVIYLAEVLTYRLASCGIIYKFPYVISSMQKNFCKKKKKKNLGALIVEST